MLLLRLHKNPRNSKISHACGWEECGLLRRIVCIPRKLIYKTGKTRNLYPIKRNLWTKVKTTIPRSVIYELTNVFQKI